MLNLHQYYCDHNDTAHPVEHTNKQQVFTVQNALRLGQKRVL